MRKCVVMIMANQIKGMIQSQKLNASFTYKTREVVVNEKKHYSIEFTEVNFAEELGLWKITIPNTTHNLGVNYIVQKLTRKIDGNDELCMVQWKMLVNGDFVLLADEPFKGTLWIQER